MADAYAIKLSVLWCGQGMANVLETFLTQKDLEDGKPSKIVLIDFGATGSNGYGKGMAKKVGTAIDFIDKLTKDRPNPKIDIAIVSHFDHDHWLLLKPLVDVLKNKKEESSNKDDDNSKQKVIGKFIRGGLPKNWVGGKKDNKVSLRPNTLEKYYNAIVAAATESKYFAEISDETDLKLNHSDYYHGNSKDLGELTSVDGVALRTLIANVPDGKPDAYSSDNINSSSLMVAVDFKLKDGIENRMILSGDATCTTLQTLNPILKKWVVNPLKPVMMMTVPHHGATNTMKEKKKQEESADGIAQANGNGAGAGNPGSDRKRKRDEDGEDKNKRPKLIQYESLHKFIEITKPAAIVASADRGHEHPKKVILDIMGDYTTPGNYAAGVEVKDEIGEHIIVAHTDDTENPWPQFKLGENGGKNANIFTTRLTATSGTIQVGVNKKDAHIADYHFTITPTGFSQEWTPRKILRLGKLVGVSNMAPYFPLEPAAVEPGPAPMDTSIPGESKENIVISPPVRGRPFVGADSRFPLNPIAAMRAGVSSARSVRAPIRRVCPIRPVSAPPNP